MHFHYSPNGKVKPGEFPVLDLNEEDMPLVIATNGKAAMIVNDIIDKQELKRIQWTRKVANVFKPDNNDEETPLATNGIEGPKNMVSTVVVNQPNTRSPEPQTSGIATVDTGSEGNTISPDGQDLHPAGKESQESPNTEGKRSTRKRKG